MTLDADKLLDDLIAARRELSAAYIEIRQLRESLEQTEQAAWATMRYALAYKRVLWASVDDETFAYAVEIVSPRLDELAAAAGALQATTRGSEIEG